MGKMLNKMKNITVIALRPPKLVDILAVRHGRYIDRDWMIVKRSVLRVMSSVYLLIFG